MASSDGMDRIIYRVREDERRKRRSVSTGSGSISSRRQSSSGAPANSASETRPCIRTHTWLRPADTLYSITNALNNHFWQSLSSSRCWSRRFHKLRIRLHPWCPLYGQLDQTRSEEEYDEQKAIGVGEADDQARQLACISTDDNSNGLPPLLGDQVPDECNHDERRYAQIKLGIHPERLFEAISTRPRTRSPLHRLELTRGPVL